MYHLASHNTNHFVFLINSYSSFPKLIVTKTCYSTIFTKLQTLAEFGLDNEEAYVGVPPLVTCKPNLARPKWVACNQDMYLQRLLTVPFSFYNNIIYICTFFFIVLYVGTPVPDR